MHPRSSAPAPKVTALVVVGVLGLAALGVAGILFSYADAASCSTGEREVLRQFRHYAGHRIEPYSTPAVGSCNASYPTHASQGQVLGYYQKQLRSRGWTLKVTTPPPLSELPKKQRKEATEHGAKYVRLTSLTARRNSYTYIVEFHPQGSAEAPPGKARVFVSVTGG